MADQFEKGRPKCSFSAGTHAIEEADHADHHCVPRVWRAKRATLEAHTAFLRGLDLRSVCVPAVKLHFGLTFQFWSDFAELGYY